MALIKFMHFVWGTTTPGVGRITLTFSGKKQFIVI